MTCTRLGIYQQNYDFELPGTTGSIFCGPRSLYICY